MIFPSCFSKMKQKEVAVSHSKPPRLISMKSLVSRLLLEVTDFASVVACICTVLGLIWLTFAKDFLEILLYAAFKYVHRTKWLYQISRIDSLFEDFYDIQRQYKMHSTPQESDDSCTRQTSNNSSTTNAPSNGSAQKQLLKYSPSTPCSVRSKLLVYPRTIDFIRQPSKPEENSASVNNTSPETNNSLKPEKIASGSEIGVISSPTQDIDLNPNSNCKGKVCASPERKSQGRRKRFGWSFNRFRDAFGKDGDVSSLHRVKEKCEDLAAKVFKIIPSNAGDTEKFIESIDENAGCCDAILSCFKSNLPTKEIVPSSMQYKHF